MSDARELQPRVKTLDLASQGSGERFYTVIRTSRYSSIKPEVVYPETFTVVFRVPDFDRAVQFAKAMATIIAQAHDVHRSVVDEVGRARFPDCKAENGKAHPVTGSIGVLTVAHLHHQPENCGDDKLRAMCQRCCNTYNTPMRRAGIRERAFTNQTKLELD